jgi:NADP-dependent 3-hydroxy acid dehydrogenase YdfG
MGRLDEQVTVITGASSGIGAAAAIAVAAEGSGVVVAARREDRLRKVVGEIEAAGGRVLLVPGDLTREEDVARLYDAAVDEFGQVDNLVNNVGVGSYGPLELMSVEDYDRMMDTNMRSSFLCTHAFLPAMKQRGHGQICFISSVAGLRGMPNEAIYCATKFAQVGFAQALDYETRELGIKVSVIAPGGVHTEFAIGSGRVADDPALERMLDAQDVAAAVVFALSQPAKSRTFLIGMRPMSEPL